MNAPNPDTRYAPWGTPLPKERIKTPAAWLMCQGFNYVADAPLKAIADLVEERAWRAVATEVLQACLAYMADKEEASLEGERYEGNPEMRLANQIRDLGVEK